MRSTNETRLFAAAIVLAALVGCGGGGSGGAMVPTNPGSGTTPTPPASTPTPPVSTPSPPGPSSVTTVTSAGAVIGLPDQFTPTNADTASGGQGQPVDGVLCVPTMAATYHVHPYLAVYVNGTQYAIPHGLGMKSPGAPVNGFVNTANCFYYLHTHDSSGILHVEDPSTTPISQSIYTLKTFLDIWGITAGPTNFGPFSGPVRVFTSGAMQRTELTVMANTLNYAGADPNSIPLYSHEVIVVEVGPTYPSSLPNVQFYEQH